MTSEKRINRIRKRGWQTAYAFPRVPRGVRAMPVKTQPRVLRGDGFACSEIVVCKSTLDVFLCIFASLLDGSANGQAEGL